MAEKSFARHVLEALANPYAAVNETEQLPDARIAWNPDTNRIELRMADGNRTSFPGEPTLADLVNAAYRWQQKDGDRG